MSNMKNRRREEEEGNGVVPSTPPLMKKPYKYDVFSKNLSKLGHFRLKTQDPNGHFWASMENAHPFFPFFLGTKKIVLPNSP